MVAEVYSTIKAVERVFGVGGGTFPLSWRTEVLDLPLSGR
jgi:hypothetical protein